jgi:predicted PurR-regulated permease PerM
MLRPYLTTIIVSLISVILLKPLYNFFLRLGFVKERRRIAVPLTLLTFFIIIVAPLYIVVRLSIAQISEAFTDVGLQGVDVFQQSIRAAIADLGSSDAVTEGFSTAVGTIKKVAVSIGVGLAQWILDLASSVPSLLIQLIIFIIIVASLLPVSDDLIEFSLQISPIGYELGELYNRKIATMVKSLVTGVFLIAIIQGVLMGIVYWIAGMNYVFLLVMISIILAMIPMVGISWLVIAIAILSFIAGEPNQGVIVLVGFYGVVNWVDILLRPKFMSKDAQLHTALFLLSIFGGLAWAGIMGLFYGPIVMLLLVTTIEVYVDAFAKEDGEMIGVAFPSDSRINVT